MIVSKLLLVSIRAVNTCFTNLYPPVHDLHPKKIQTPRPKVKITAVSRFKRSSDDRLKRGTAVILTFHRVYPF